MKNTVAEALRDLRDGKIVLVYDSDDRERETDMVVASEFVTPQVVMRLRKDAGGLICTAAHNDIKEKFDLPFLVDVFSCSSKDHPVMDLLSPIDIPYDTKSAFSITINHRATFTGITDTDRALTISEFAKLAKRTKGMSDELAQIEFGKTFRAPGHVHLLNASKDILVTRFGHTELTTALLVMTGITPSATVCEMMGDDGHALSKEKAKEYAQRFDLCFLEGSQIIDSWTKWEKPK
jgi:3,4-dihydroxy 2-butanone 4-phosphate synthase